MFNLYSLSLTVGVNRCKVVETIIGYQAHFDKSLFDFAEKHVDQSTCSHQVLVFVTAVGSSQAWHRWRDLISEDAKFETLSDQGYVVSHNSRSSDSRRIVIPTCDRR